MRYRIAFSLVLCSVLSSGIAAHDLGVYGKTYPIKEPDFLIEIQDVARQKVATGEWKRQELLAQERGKRYFERPPAIAGLKTVARNKTRRFDPSITLSEDIRDAEGRLIFAAGTRVNPADISPFPGALLFMSGDDSRQVALAEKLIGRKGGSLKVILVDGSPAELMRKWERPVFFDQGGAGVNRFGLTAVPVLISQAKVADRFLTIEEIKP